MLNKNGEFLHELYRSHKSLPMLQNIEPPAYEDAIRYLLRSLRKPSTSSYSNYGYDFYMPNIIRTYLKEELQVSQENDHLLVSFSPIFYAVAWDLCRRGIIRPGIKQYREQATADGSSGNGYSLTPFGKAWIAESDKDDFVPTEPERFGQMLKPFHHKFGSAYFQRAQEAVKCYGAHAYLACCVLCGASVESALIQFAVAKLGDADEVFKNCRTANGRSWLENFTIGQASDSLQKEFGGYAGLMKYWRDTAAHGSATTIADNEAFTSLALLLRFSHFLNDHWERLGQIKNKESGR